jgi:2-O-methyltransferase
MGAINYVQKKLPMSISIPLRKFSRDLRGLPSSLRHYEAARLINKSEPVIFEIGCNNADDTLAFLAEIPRAKMYCFEPDPGAVRRFKERLGADLSKVTLSEIAISDRTGTIDFHPNSGGQLPEGYPRVKLDKTIPANTCRLDDWCSENGVTDIDFIWMDVPGAEGDVIAGAANALARTRFLYTDYSNTETYQGQPSLDKLLALLPSFKVVVKYADDVLLENQTPGA